MQSEPPKLKRLDREQQAALRALAIKWAKRTRNSAPLTAADRREIVGAIARLYRAAGLRWHGVARWTDSPFEAERVALGCADKLWALRRAGRLRESRMIATWLQCMHWRDHWQRKLHWLRHASTQAARQAWSFASAAAWLGLVVGLELGILHANYWERLWHVVSAGGVLAVVGVVAGLFGGLVVWVPFFGSTSAAVGGAVVFLAASSWFGLHFAAWFSGLHVPSRTPDGFIGVLQTVAITSAAMGVSLGVAVALITFIKLYITRVQEVRIVDATASKLRRAHTTATEAVARHVTTDLWKNVREQLGRRVADPRQALQQGIEQARAELLLDESVRCRVEASVRHIALRYMKSPVPFNIGELDPSAASRHVVGELDGQFQGCELAATAFFREQLRPELHAVDLTALDDFEIATRAGAWWPHRDFVVICERHQSLYAQGQTLHRAEGPALQWPGLRLYFSHGENISRSLLERAWQADEISLLDHPQRRAVIEHMGWPRYLELAGAREIARADDPGNPGRTLVLYEAPAPYAGSFRVLIMINGSPEPTGEYRVFGETVPSWLQRPIEAAAWSYNCPEDVYRQLRRRT